MTPETGCQQEGPCSSVSVCEAALGLREMAAFIVRVHVGALLFDQTVEVLRCVCSLPEFAEKKLCMSSGVREKKSAVSFFVVCLCGRQRD